MKNIKNYILQLQDKIRYHNYLYYTLSSPIISDEKYDLLILKLKKLELKYQKILKFFSSPTNSIGSLNLPGLKQYNHITSMLSLDNVFTEQDFLMFYNKIKNNCSSNNITFCSELKIDGVAINLIYKSGILFRAVTRGDGYIGEDVTSNVYLIESIPYQLSGVDIPEVLEVRGEIFMLKSNFLKLNNKKNLLENKLFSNTRNATSGLLRQKNCKVEYLKHLTFCCYGSGYCSKLNFLDSHFLRLKQFKKWGIPISSYNFLCSSSKKILSFYHFIQKQRQFLDFDIDGIVIKVDSIFYQNLLSTTSKAPRWAFAFKFFNEMKKTIIKKVICQVGRTGVITPVAEIDPIHISGVLIKRVSLHNFNEIKKLNLHIGDYVFIKRAGDVIPKVVGLVNKYRSTQNMTKICLPEFCPECHSILKISNELNLKIRCASGLKCSGQLKKLLHYFCSNKGLNIQGLGPKIIDKLVNLGYVNGLLDVFNLNESLLIKVEGIGEKIAANIVRSINISKNVSFSKFLCALGIPEVGGAIAKNISEHYQTINKFLNSSKDNFFLVCGIGENIANNLYNFINNEFNRDSIFKLSKILNIYLDDSVTQYRSNFFLFQKKIVFTGQFSFFSRSQILELTQKLGAIVISSISKSVDYIIVGKKPGQKLIKSQKFNIPKINEKKFFEIIKKYI